jgi:hypothetical protein
MESVTGLVMAAAAAISVLAGCSDTTSTAKARPQQAGQPMDPLRTAGHLATIQGSALLGDQDGIRNGMAAMNEDFRRAIKLADPARRVDREAGRAALQGLEGLASVVWLDQANLFVLVERNELRTHAVVDAICVRLEPLGDTLGVVVNLQSTAARTAEEQATLSRNCQLQPGEHALLHRPRQVDVVPAEIRAQQRRAQALADQRGDRSRQAQASLEILMGSTPELPVDPRRQ